MLKSLSPIDVALIKKIGGNGSSYTLPIASSTQLGGVQPAAKTDAMTQEVGVDGAGGLWTAPGSGGSGGGWRVVQELTPLSDMVSQAEWTFPQGTKKVLIYGSISLNDANNSLDSGAKRVSVYINDGLNYILLFTGYTRKTKAFPFELLLDVEIGVLIVNFGINGNGVQGTATCSMGTMSTFELDSITKVLLRANVDGDYLFTTTTSFGVRAYVQNG